MPVDPARAKSLFLAASDISSPAERAAFLDRECGGDAELRARVEALLAAEGRAGPAGGPEATSMVEPTRGTHTVAETRHGTVEIPRGPGAGDGTETVADGQQTTLEGPASPSPGPRPVGFAPGRVIAGRYILREVLGEGGMGTVYRADQTEPVRRQVALKLIRVGMDSRAVLARFDAERQALALMDHPNIARVYDGGTTDAGRPYFAMELVRGVPITDHCDRERLPVKARLELFVAICQAVQHAHQKGIIHRDLKPSNVLVAEVDGRPTPKVIDFGVAKAVEFDLTDQSLGDTGAIVGTPAYMSPEQADPSSMDIDTRTDVYALGVILYELLAGSTPLKPSQLKRGAVQEMLRMVREMDPPRPSTRVSTADALPSIAAVRGVDPAQLKRSLSGDLDWIVMKALEKDRGRRYETANGFAADILRHLASEPVLAAPPSRAYQFRKFVGRHRGGVTAVGLVLLALLAGMAGTGWGLYQAEMANAALAGKNRDLAEEKRKVEQRSQLALDAVKKFRDAVEQNPELKGDPGLASLRRTLLKEPLAFFRDLHARLQADQDTHPDAMRRLADAAYDLGHLNALIGDRRDALISLREALAIYQKLADADPRDVDLEIRLADLHNDLGGTLHLIGEPAEAMKAFEVALATARKLADARPTDGRIRSCLADSLTNIGIMRGESGEPSEALTTFASVLPIRRELADAEPANIERRRELMALHVRMGGQFRAARRGAESARAYVAALDIGDKLAEAEPTNTRLLINLADARGNFANLLREIGDPPKAMEEQEKALKILRKLAEDHPTTTMFQQRLVAAYLNLGVGHRNAGEPAKAMRSYESALPILRKLVKDHPESADLASMLGGALNNVARVDLDANRFEEARGKLREAVECQRKALATNPDHPQYRRFLASHFDNLRDAASGLGDADGVAEAEREIARLDDTNPETRALDARLAAVLRGADQPRSEAERLALALRAQETALPATAARLWAEAFAVNPGLVDTSMNLHRYRAARAAALAARGGGNDAPPGEAARAGLRQQALAWLVADLEGWDRLATAEPVLRKQLVLDALADWKGNADFAGVRDPEELEKLPEAERSAFGKLWADVDALLARLRDGQ